MGKKMMKPMQVETYRHTWVSTVYSFVGRKLFTGPIKDPPITARMGHSITSFD